MNYYVLHNSQTQKSDPYMKDTDRERLVRVSSRWLQKTQMPPDIHLHEDLTNEDIVRVFHYEIKEITKEEYYEIKPQSFMRR